jgi:FAD/FMN-containing dehydrogenase
MQTQQHIVNDVTRLNPVPVWAVATPTSIEEVQEAVRRFTGAISIGGGRFSMGGHTASPGSLHLDMRKFNRVIEFSPVRRTIRVQPGIRWCDIQRFIDPHGLAVRIMQTYANFTVGGSLSVNCHGRYVGLGPLILSVRAISIVLADGDLVQASPAHNAEIFYGAIGCYGALGVIVEAELDLAENKRVERIAVKLPAKNYLAYFRKKVRNSSEAVFHNADLYAPHYSSARSVTWVETKKPATTPYRMQPFRKAYPLENYFLWAVTETPFGKWRREFIIDPVLYLFPKVHWRNYEAGYDVAELEPPSRKRRTYVLQEYFVPVERFDEFVPKMTEIFQRHRVNVLNVSVRHALPDPGSLLAWARQETFAFVVYYKQRTRENAKNRVAVWTRELIDAALSVNGSYYLPYQAHATPEQFHRAYPRARELFALKRKLDPDFRFRNVLWDKYYAPTLHEPAPSPSPETEFHAVYSQVSLRDGFYRFLQNVYRLFPEDRFHTLIDEACVMHRGDEAIYRHLQEKLPGIKPLLADLFYALPALAKQKREMARQTLELLGDRRDIDGYVEIGTTGRYLSELRKHLRFRGPLIVVNDLAPTNSPVDIVERGQIARLGSYVPLNNYLPLGETEIPSESVDLVSCYIGLHHIAPEALGAFMTSICRVLRPGGIFILRDHDVTTAEMATFVSLAHTVFNAGLGVPWEVNQQELRYFVSVEEWVRRLEAVGLEDSGRRLVQTHDPSDNVLMAFVKSAPTSH